MISMSRRREIDTRLPSIVFGRGFSPLRAAERIADNKSSVFVFCIAQSVHSQDGTMRTSRERILTAGERRVNAKFTDFHWQVGAYCSLNKIRSSSFDVVLTEESRLEEFSKSSLNVS